MLRTVFRLLVLGGGIFAVLRLVRPRGPAMRDRFMEMCDRMMDEMPESFPPKRMMADLEAIRLNTERILEALQVQPDQQAAPPEGGPPADSDAPAESQETAT